MNWWQTVIVPIVSVLFGGGLATAINAVAKRGVTKVEVADRLNESTLEWAEQLKSDATGARVEAAEARREAAEARRDATEVRRDLHDIKVDAEQVVRYLGQVVRWIQSPDMTMERLRVLVSQSGPLNGMARKE